MRLFLVILLSFAFGSSNAQTNNLNFKHFTVDQGLSQGTVNSLVFDSLGYLWIGTNDGLNRFDGNNFSVYRHSPDDSLSLPDSKIVSVHPNTDGTLWVITDTYIVRFSPNQNRTLLKFPLFKPLNYRKIITVNSAEKHLDYFDIVIGLMRFHYAEKKLEYLSGAVTPPRVITKYNTPTNLHDVYKMDSAYWLFWNTGHVSTMRISDGAIQHLPLQFNYSAVAAAHVKNGSYWLSTRDKLYNISANYQILDSVEYTDGFQADRYSQIVCTEQNQLWINSYGYGLMKFNPVTFHQQHFKHEESQEGSINYNYLMCIAQDHFGNIWTGTNAKGFDGLLANAQTFKAFTPAQNAKPAPLSSEFVRSIYLSKDSVLYVGYNDLGLDKIDLKTGKKSNFRFSNKGDNSILSIQPNQYEDFYWLGTYDYGLAVLKNNKLLQLKDLEDLGVEVFRGVIPLKNNACVYNLTPGIRSARLVENTIIPLKTLITDETKVEQIYSFNNQHFLLNNDSIKRITYYSEDSLSYTHFYKAQHQVKCVVPLNDTLTFIGTTNGLLLYNPKTYITQVLTTKHGLPNNHIYSVLPWKNNSVWISTNYGLSHYNYISQSFENYTTADGLPGNEFNTGAAYLHSDGTLFFGAMGGVVSIPPQNIPKSKLGSPLLAAVKINDNTPINWNLDTIFSFQQNTFTFHLTHSDLLQHSRYKYQCMLSYADDNWVDLGENNYSRYTQLAPGNYTFNYRVGKNNIWSTPKQFSFRITPPFWKTKWFIVLSVLALGTLITLLIRSITRLQLRKEIEELKTQQKLEADRNRISRELHDNIGSHLSIIINNIEEAQKLIETNKIEESLAVVKNTHVQSKYTIEQLRETIWALKKSQLGIDDFIARVKIYLQVFFRHTGIDNKISSNVRATLSLNPLSSLTLFRVLQEAANNTLKHAEANHFQVSFSYITGGIIQLIITDNGKGFDIDQIERGEGLENIEARIKEIGGEIQINKNGDSTGTTILIRLKKSDI